MKISKFLGLILAICIVAPSTFASDYVELQVNLAGRTNCHEGSYTDAYLFDHYDNLLDSKTINHGATAINGGIDVFFYRGGLIGATYFGPGGFAYPTGLHQVCLPDPDNTWPCPNKNIAYVNMYLPKDTTVNFLNMGRPYANKPVSIAYLGDDGEFWASTPMTTNASGQAVFLPKNGTPFFGGKVLANNIGDYNTDIQLSGGTAGTTVLIEKERPAPLQWTSAPISGSSNINLTIFWENLAATPGHQDYLFILYDINGNNAGHAYTLNNQMSITIAPGTPFYFRVVAFDTENRTYADSEAWSITAPSSLSAVSDSVNKEKILRIEQEEVQVDSANTVTGKSFARSQFEKSKAVLPSNLTRRVTSGMKREINTPKLLERMDTNTSPEMNNTDCLTCTQVE